MEWFPPKVRNKARCLIPPLLLSIVLNVFIVIPYLVIYSKKRKEGIEIAKEYASLPLLRGTITVYL